MSSAAAPEGYGLGGASFALSVDAGSFEPSLRRAEEMARKSGKAIGDNLSGGAGRGLLMIGQLADDAQYGFRSIVNNIPGVVTALGGTAGLAGAIGIVAVGLNQVINHWDSLDGKLENLENWRAAKVVADDFYQSLSKFASGSPALAPLMALINDPGGGGALKAGRGRDEAAGQKLFADAQDDVVDKQKAADFKAAIEESGGLKKVLGDALKQAMAAPGADEATQKGRIAKWYEAGAKGDKFNPDAFGGGFGKAFDAQENRRMEARAAKGEAEAKEAAEAGKKQADDRKVHDLEVQKDALEKRRGAIQEQVSNRPHYDTFGGVGEMINAMQSERFNRVPTQQLDELKGIKAGIEKLNDEIRGVRGAKFG